MTFPAAHQPPRPLLFLRRYYSSGWTFFIPYLCAYLLYYRLKWPVSQSGSGPPPLLHVFWALHAANLLLGGFVLRAGWLPLPAPRLSVLRRALFPGLPWLLLGLVFFIPGTYLEFPGDLWEHYRRINEWAVLSEVGNHSVWFKSSYFFAFSLLGRVPANHQILGLDIFNAAMGLLLCRQYFMLARTVGIGKRAAFLFVLVQALLFGNSIFSFYRYYGIASTILAQIGAIALIRIGLAFAPARIFPSLVSAVCLFLLIAFNHVQGLGIAGLGLAAAAGWRLVRWRRSMSWSIAVTAMILSLAAIRWCPRNPALDAVLRPVGVLNAWYGFNLFSLHSIAADRMLQIVGIFGLVNLAAGVFLLGRNHVVGWLTIMPVISLSLPFVAIPLADTLVRQHWVDIVAFHRMFLAIPSGLALICVAEEIAGRPGASSWDRPGALAPSGLLLAGLLLFTTVPSAGPYYNRFWHALVTPPADFSMKPAWHDFHAYTQAANHLPPSIFAASTGLSWVLATQRPVSIVCNTGRTYYNNNCVPSADLDLIRRSLREDPADRRLAVAVPSPFMFYTAFSYAAISSGHWLPQEAALTVAGARELPAMSRAAGLRPVDSTRQVVFYQHN